MLPASSLRPQSWKDIEDGLTLAALGRDTTIEPSNFLAFEFQREIHPVPIQRGFDDYRRRSVTIDEDHQYIGGIGRSIFGLADHGRAMRADVEGTVKVNSTMDRRPSNPGTNYLMN